MQQRGIYLAKLPPTKGSEQGDTRPVVVISGNTMNENLEIGIVCPISSKIKNYATCIQLKKNKTNNLEQNSEIITFQIRTISQNRLIKKIGEITEKELQQILAGLQLVMKY